ncbi:MAG: primosomal protein N', partial [Aquificaceae bacterium]|nr:primosomal protein N' [Aquificaceae bacterium]
MNLKLALPNGRTLKVKAFFPYSDSPLGYRVLLKGSEGGRTAIVVGFAEEGKELSLEFPDDRPITTKRHMSALVETAEHYALMPWRLLFDLLPSILDWKEESLLVIGGHGLNFLDRKSRELIEYVRSRRSVKEDALKERFGKDLVEKLIELGFLKRRKDWKMPDMTKTLYGLALPFEEVINRLKVFKNKEEKLRLVYHLRERVVVSKEELREAGFDWRDVKDLIRKGIVAEKEEDLRGTKSLESSTKDRVNYLKPIGGKSIIFGSWEKVLLRVSGELQRLVGEGKSAFLFCDNLQLIESLETHLYPLLGDRLVVLSSRERPKDFIQRWFSLHSAVGVVVLGSRLSLLAPIKGLDLLLCFGSEPHLLPNGADLRYYLYRLSQNYGASFSIVDPMPPLSLWIKEDWQKEYFPPASEVFVVKRKWDEVLSPDLKSLVDKENCLFLVNKTGYSYGFCSFCGWMAECPVCRGFLTMSKDRERAFCASCGYKGDAKCPECGKSLQELGFGIDKAVEEVDRCFGKSTNYHFDTVPRLGKVYDQVFVLHADNILSVPWFDSQERYFSYLWKALCTSRKRFVVQTVLDKNPILEYVKNKDYQGFFQEELKIREEEGLPPFKRLVVTKLKTVPTFKDLPVEVKRRRLGEIFELLIKV